MNTETNTHQLPPDMATMVDNITADNYAEAAERTEAPVGPAIERFTPEIACLFVEAMNESVKTGAMFDILKRHVYYGKELPEGTLRYLQAHVSLTAKSHDWMEGSLERARTLKVMRLLHVYCGLQTETSELGKQLFEHIFEGKPLDEVNVAEEMGDLCWYVGVGCRVIGMTLSSLLKQNIAKLARRFGARFSTFAALNRNLGAERAVLESRQ